MIRRDALVESGGFDESLTACEDWDMGYGWHLKPGARSPGTPSPWSGLNMMPASMSTDPARMLKKVSRIIEKTLVYEMNGWRRSLERRRIWAAQLSSAAVEMHMKGSARRAKLFPAVDLRVAFASVHAQMLVGVVAKYPPAFRSATISQ